MPDDPKFINTPIFFSIAEYRSPGRRQLSMTFCFRQKVNNIQLILSILSKFVLIKNKNPFLFWKLLSIDYVLFDNESGGIATYHPNSGLKAPALMPTHIVVQNPTLHISPGPEAGFA